MWDANFVSQNKPDCMNINFINFVCVEVNIKLAKISDKKKNFFFIIDILDFLKALYKLTSFMTN